MTTDKILEEIKKVQFEDIRHYEDFNFLTDEDFEKLDEVAVETTNPRRDYIGSEYIILNKEDNRYFAVEFYGNDMSYEIGNFGEVTRKVETKEVITFEPVK